MTVARSFISPRYVDYARHARLTLKRFVGNDTRAFVSRPDEIKI
jgi:hypothetical protein